MTAAALGEWGDTCSWGSQGLGCVCICVHAGLCVVVCVLARVGHVCVEVCLPVVLCLSVSTWERVGRHQPVSIA